MQHEKLKIVAAGGGAPNKSSGSALTHAVEMSGVEKPRVLIIPSAKTTQEAHDSTVRATEELYVDRLGLEMRVLHGFEQPPTKTQVEHEIGSADVAYIPGGDTARMMEAWAATGIAATLGSAALKGSVVLSGVSAGAIAPFRWGHSDSLSYRPGRENDWDFIPVDGLGLVNAGITPHHNTKNERLGPRSESFQRMFNTIGAEKSTPVGIGIDNFAAVIVEDGKLKPFYPNPEHRVHILGVSQGPRIMDEDECISINSI